jgi:predicted ArsR family transcriptional regulator
MQLTRQQIVDYLQANHKATSIELARALLVTAANVRHHLRILTEAGLVEVVGQEHMRRRGRPTKLYRLTENALKHNLEGLASALLKALLKNNIEANVALAQTATHLLGDYDLAATNAHARLNQMVEKLNQLNYQSTWEASSSGPRIVLRNCPYAMILSEHSELCRLDAVLLARMLNQPVEQTSKLERNPNGSPHCIFITRNL